jgi:hypothetical protein
MYWQIFYIDFGISRTGDPEHQMYSIFWFLIFPCRAAIPVRAVAESWVPEGPRKA